jgi:hypothetical protein
MNAGRFRMPTASGWFVQVLAIALAGVVLSGSLGAHLQDVTKPVIRCVTRIGLASDTEFAIVGSGFGTVPKGAAWGFIHVEDRTGKWSEESLSPGLK